MIGLLLALGAGAGQTWAQTPAAAAGAFATPLTVENLDPAALAQWVEGAQTPVVLKDGPRHVVWTRSTPPEWDGVHFGAGKMPGVRHLRLGFKAPLPVGSVLVRAGGCLSVLKPSADYPGNLADDTQWIPAARLKDGTVGQAEVADEEYAVWVLPPGTSTRALRFTHTAPLTDSHYAGWLGGAFILRERCANIAPQALATASARPEAAERINNETNDNMWHAWDNGPDGATMPVAQRPEWVMLTWAQPTRLCGLGALWAGFGTAEAQVYAGPADRHPRDAAESDWKSVNVFEHLDSQYPRALGVNWMDFGQAITTSAVRLRLTQVTHEGHPHVMGRTKEGKRVWLGELLALEPLGAADLKAALPPPPTAASHPPIPIRFNLKEPGYVTLVIDDAAGRRVRNLLAETLFPAGDNVAWWDGMDDLLRDKEAAGHGVYHIPMQLVGPGDYRVRGLSRRTLELHYEFSLYSAGNPPWETADHSGGWLTNHTPPSAALFVPAPPGDKPMVYLGSYISEGGAGLAWVDLEGHKQGGRGWVGGNWTAAPYLARDAGAQADGQVQAYVGAAWEGELRLTALTADGDKPVLVPTYKFPGNTDHEKKANSVLGGIALHNGLLVASLPAQNKLLLVDALHHAVQAVAELVDGRGVAFDSQGRLLALSGTRLVRYTLRAAAGGESPLTEPTVLCDHLQDPQGITTDPQGNIYISDRGTSHQVKVFDPAGKLLRAIGHAGAPHAGPYDGLHMNNPKGLTIDTAGHLWVAEEDFQPKRVSVWSTDGTFWKAFYGPAEYGGGGVLDPQDKTRFYYHGMEFKVDWKTGANEPVAVLWRPGPGELPLPTGHADGMPETPLYVDGRQYLTNCFNSNPTNGAGIAMLWLRKDGVARPVAAMGQADLWDLLKGAAFKPHWPAGVDLTSERAKRTTFFAWCDLNGDGLVQPDEVTFLKAASGGITVMPDLSFVAARVDERAMRYAPQKFTAASVPLYDLQAGQTLVTGAQPPVSSGGDQALIGTHGWTIFTNAPKPLSAFGLGGARDGVALWSYPSPWPGLHASHEAPAPSFPGQVIGHTRLLGNMVTPKAGEAGPLWCVNGNMGNMYLFTQDGLFVAQLFQDVRQGKLWSMPVAQRGMLVNDLTLHDENFWPTISQVAGGQIYLNSSLPNIVRIDGLESIHRLPETALPITPADLQNAGAWCLAAEALRQQAQGTGTLQVALANTPPVVDGILDEWEKAHWAVIDRSGVAANFNSHSKPYDVAAAVAIAGERLYAAFRTADPNLLRNSGEMPTAPFKTGGALDLMLGVNPGADPKRAEPVEGDLRLLVTQVKGKTLAILYRAVVPGSKEPVPFSSPWRTIRFDRVENVSDQVQLAGADGNYELSIPLAVLGLKAQAGQRIRGDIGILRGDGSQTLQRVYWSNKATGITADVPSEAQLAPRLWGQWEFIGVP